MVCTTVVAGFQPASVGRILAPSAIERGGRRRWHEDMVTEAPPQSCQGYDNAPPSLHAYYLVTTWYLLGYRSSDSRVSLACSAVSGGWLKRVYTECKLLW